MKPELSICAQKQQEMEEFNAWGPTKCSMDDLQKAGIKRVEILVNSGDEEEVVQGSRELPGNPRVS